MDTRLRNIGAEICIRRIVGCKSKEQWQKTGIYVIESKEKWEMIKKNKSGVEIHLYKQY
jgi:hypothetical protein